MQVGARVRSTDDGQLGHIVEGPDGVLWVKLDRRGEDRRVPYQERAWVEDVAPKLTEMQIARVCYDVDRAWQLIHGGYSVTDWVSVRETERVRWSREGPPKGADKRRLRLYAGVKRLLLTIGEDW